MASAVPAAARAVLLSGSEQRTLARRLSFALAAAACLIVSAGVELLDPSQRDVAQLVAGVAALLVGVPALRAAWGSLRDAKLSGVTEQLIALAFLAAWASGDLRTAALLPLIMMIGRILEERSLLGSQEAIAALTKLTATRARRLAGDGRIEDVASADLRPGDRIELRAGDRVPADGVIETGFSSVDTAPITGESTPAELDTGDTIFNGSINLDGHLTVRITRVGTETTLGRIVALMKDVERTKPAVARLLDRHAPRYLMFVLLLTASIWLLSGDTTAALAVLIAACPSALVLAAPATAIAAIAVASRHGILVKGPAFLEQMAIVDSVVFDKTGTLTVGTLHLVKAVPQPGYNAATLLKLAGSLGAASSHPVSRALDAHTAQMERAVIDNLHETRGLGLLGELDGERVAFGRARLFEELGIAATPPPDHSGPLAGVSRGDTFIGWLLLADQVRPEAHDAVEDLRAIGLRRQLLITGDRHDEAKRVAALLGIVEVHAGALPEQKMEFVRAVIREGYRPMVVGDGINDALALKAGAVGVAMGAQVTDVALASADLVLMTSDVRRLATCIRLSRRSQRTILINVAISLGWSVLLIGLAVAGVFGASGALVAASLQNVGIVVVMANAGRLLKFSEALPGVPEAADLS